MPKMYEFGGHICQEMHVVVKVKDKIASDLHLLEGCGSSRNGKSASSDLHVFLYLCRT